MFSGSALDARAESVEVELASGRRHRAKRVTTTFESRRQNAICTLRSWVSYAQNTGVDITSAVLEGNGPVETDPWRMVVDPVLLYD